MSQAKDTADAEVLSLARAAIPNARITSHATRESYSCFIIVDTDDEKRLVNDDANLLNAMKSAASGLLKLSAYVTAESQETVDRRWGGNWNYVFR